MQTLTLISMKYMTQFLLITGRQLKIVQRPVVNVISASMHLGSVVLSSLQLAKWLLSGTRKMMNGTTGPFAGEKNS